MFSFQNDITQFYFELESLNQAPWTIDNSIEHIDRNLTLKKLQNGLGIPVILCLPENSETIVNDTNLKELARDFKYLKETVNPIYIAKWNSEEFSNENSTINDLIVQLDSAISKIGGKAHVIGLCTGGSGVFASAYPNNSILYWG